MAQKYETKVPEIKADLPKERVAEVVGTGLKTELGRSTRSFIAGGIVDYVIDAVQATTITNPVAFAAVELGEFLLEHGTGKFEGADHEHNMKSLFGGVQTMYKELLTRPDVDQKMVKKVLRQVAKGRARFEKNAAFVEGIELSMKEKIELAFQTGDVTFLKDIDMKFVPKFLKPVVMKTISNFVESSHSGMADAGKTILKEAMDIIPGISAANVMEPVRLLEIHNLIKLYNEHPDVTPEMRVSMFPSFGFGSIKRLLQHEKLRLTQSLTSVDPKELGVKILAIVNAFTQTQAPAAAA